MVHEENADIDQILHINKIPHLFAISEFGVMRTEELHFFRFLIWL